MNCCFSDHKSCIFQLRTPHNGFAELVRSFHTRVVVALRHGTCTAQLERSPRFAATLHVRTAKLICHASIAARRILKTLLYWNVGLEIPNPAGLKRFEMFFQLFIFPTFSIVVRIRTTIAPISSTRPEMDSPHPGSNTKLLSDLRLVQ